MLEGSIGPVELKLRSFGGVRGLFFGSFSEASSDVDLLLHSIVDLGLDMKMALIACALRSPLRYDADGASQQLGPMPNSYLTASHSLAAGQMLRRDQRDELPVVLRM